MLLNIQGFYKVWVHGKKRIKSGYIVKEHVLFKTKRFYSIAMLINNIFNVISNIFNA